MTPRRFCRRNAGGNDSPGAFAAEAREAEGRLLAPTQRDEGSMNLWRRIAFFFRRLVR